MQHDGEITFSDAIEFVTRNWVVIALFVLIGAGGGGALGLLSDRPYSATIPISLPGSPKTFIANDLWRTAYTSEHSRHIDTDRNRIFVTADNPVAARNLAEAARVEMLRAAQGAIDEFRERYEREVGNDSMQDQLAQEALDASALERWHLRLEGAALVSRQLGTHPLNAALIGGAMGGLFGIFAALFMGSLWRRRQTV